MTTPGPGIDLDVNAAIGAGRRLHQAGESMAHERAASGARIEQAGRGRPWGDDELGRAFGKDYEDPAGRLLALWRDAAHRTAAMGADVVTAAGGTQDVDQASHARLGQVRR